MKTLIVCWKIITGAPEEQTERVCVYIIVCMMHNFICIGKYCNQSLLDYKKYNQTQGRNYKKCNQTQGRNYKKYNQTQGRLTLEEEPSCESSMCI